MAWIFKIIGLFSIIPIMVIGQPSHFDLSVPNYSSCFEANAKLVNLDISSSSRYTRGKLKLLITYEGKNYWVRQLYSGFLEDSIKGKLSIGEIYRFRFSKTSNNWKNKFWEISKGNEIILSYDLIKTDYQRMKTYLYSSFLGLAIGILGYFMEFINKRNKAIKKYL